MFLRGIISDATFSQRVPRESRKKRMWAPAQEGVVQRSPPSTRPQGNVIMKPRVSRTPHSFSLNVALMVHINWLHLALGFSSATLELRHLGQLLKLSEPLFLHL